MDYKEKYEQALERAKGLLEDMDKGDYFASNGAIENIFPELKEKESEDEKIRKAIHIYLDWLDDSKACAPKGIYSIKEMLAWLEKQGEDKHTDKVEPKFKVGEWITNDDYIWKIVEVTPLDYILQSQDGDIVDDTISYVDEQFHSFTIEDAKDGDVVLTVAYDPTKHPDKNNYVDGCWQFRVYEPIYLGQIEDILYL